ncbi:MAG: glycoside hydrolase family 16 protein, partial [Bacteroidota bacterium]
IIWEEDRIKWLLNDQIYHEIDKTYVESLGQNYPFNDDFFLLFSLSVGGNLPADPIAAEYPSSLIVDYVRVFQKN